MDKNKTIRGFSKLSKLGKIRWIVEHFFTEPDVVMKELKSYWLVNEDQQKVFDGFSENTISNFPLPYGVAPNFVINNKTYAVPMVIEESSVVAAAAAGAKYWMSRGGFQVEILSMIKSGQVHFYWDGPKEQLFEKFDHLRGLLFENTNSITANMRKRGGGILSIELVSFDEEAYYYQLDVRVDTCDSMGANFINSILEEFARTLDVWIHEQPAFISSGYRCEIIMSILSNYTPECMVKASVSCSVAELGEFIGGMNADTFADRFCRAVRIARINPFRATTHNKGIFNGIDAVVLATGNDFRAIEACGHTHAARSGKYRGLSDCMVENGIFSFWLELPLAVGTVGGLTNLHPIAKRSLELLGHPNASELMGIIAATGLAQNFSALKSLITTGIQQGHMKLHLMNILNSMQVSEVDSEAARLHFKQHVVSYAAVRDFLELHRMKLNKID